MAELSIQFLPAEYHPSSALASLASELVWSAGDGSLADIWRYVPGASAPERIFTNTRRDSYVYQVLKSNGGYAFTEQNDREYGEGAWRIWLLPQEAGEPIELDRGLALGAQAPPNLAVSGDTLVWTAFDEAGGGAKSVLRSVSVATPRQVRTVVSMAVRDGLMWYPQLEGRTVWYAIIHADWDATGPGDEFHIEHLDLDARSPQIERFAGSGNDFNPVVNPRYVVWKTVRPGFAALNWGRLTILDRDTGEVINIPGENLNNPTLGERFVAFEEITRSKLELYDLATRRIMPVELIGVDQPSVANASVMGSLLTFSAAAAGGQPQIGWAFLPH